MLHGSGRKVDRAFGTRGLAGAFAAVVIVVVLAVAGAGTYFALNSMKASPVLRSSCFPASSPTCVASQHTHDVGLLVPFKATQEGTVVPFTAALPAGESASTYAFNFGDGTTSAPSGQPIASHVYASAGTYIVSVQATVGGAIHDNYHGLVTVAITSTFSSSLSGNQPGVSGAITANSSTVSGAAPTAVLQPSGTVTFSGTYTSAPTNPLFSFASPTFTAAVGASLSGSVAATNTSATATYLFSNPGTYWVTFEGKAAGPAGVIAYQNYTWTVFVAANGLHAGLAGTGTAVSHHKGLIVYELIPGGSSSEDPAIDYETAGYEPMLNVYQTLISYNSSQTGPTYTSYVPTLAVCVPGSPQCTSEFGSTLISGNDYTFVIDGKAQFYDPTTKASWGVYPTDVLFSILRTMAFSQLPCYGCNNGWILTQSLLPVGSPSWDGGIHNSRNNTPSNMLAAMSINESGFCPNVATTSPAYHGCVTFHVDGAGHAWPYFLELIADGEGAGIVPCGWFSASPQSAGIPDWTYGNVSGSGDHPCPLPGTGGYGVAVPSSPTAWDKWEVIGSGSSSPGVYWGSVQFAMAGSGPYYLSNIQPGVSYSLAVNPAYVHPSGCSGSGCEPTPGSYPSTVSVTWETTQTPGEQAYSAGAADFASIPQTDVALLLSLIQQGKVGATSFPSISIYFWPFNFAFNAPGATKYTSNPITVPSDFFSHVAARQFLSRAYPYTTIENTIQTKDGIQYLFNYGGAIPQFMANYYPTNVSFPNADPCTSATNSACPAYWWTQGTTPSSPFYDPELAACKASSPCEFPWFGETGVPSLDQQAALWASSVGALSGGAIKVDPLDINFIDLVLNTYLAPYQNPMPMFQLGWAPDYPDPTDYITPMYLPDSSYTAADTVNEQATLPQFNATSCHSWQDYVYWANLAKSSGIPDNCQGAAYAAMTYLEGIAAIAPAGPQRVLDYNWVEQIANGLALYVYWGQANEVASYAPWIDGSSINNNVTIGGGGDQTWYTITGNGVS